MHIIKTLYNIFFNHFHRSNWYFTIIALLGADPAGYHFKMPALVLLYIRLVIVKNKIVLAFCIMWITQMLRHDLKTYNTDYVDGKEDTTYLAIYLKVFQLGAVWTVFTAKRAPSNEFILQFLNQSSYAAYLLMRQTPSSDTTHNT